ncbi:MAG: spermidine synthase, partial [Bdellovibrionota bacterium]
PLLIVYGGPGAVLAVAAISPLAITLALDKNRKSERYKGVAVCLFMILSLLVSLKTEFFSIHSAPTEGKEKLFEAWNPISRITVYGMQTSPWLQENVLEQPVFSEKLIFIDAWATTPIIPKEAWASTRQMLHDLSAAPYAVTKRDRALIIGAGGGRDIMVALGAGFKSVDAVEINRSIVNLMSQGEFSEYSGGIYNDPRVQIHTMDGRNFVRESRDTYDNIQLTLVDTFASTAAGAFALSENNLYTVEAVRSYMNHLAPDGVLAISRWAGLDTIRLLSIMREAAKENGVSDFGIHAAVFASRLFQDSPSQAVFVLFRKSAFDTQSVEKLRTFSVESKLPLYHDPLRPVNSVIAKVILAEEHSAGAQALYPYEQRPSTDNWPFYFFRPATGYWKEALLSPQKLFTSPEYTVLGVTLLSLIACFFVLVLPVLLLGKEVPLSAGRSSFKVMPFFAAIGLGFMFVELPWIQRSVLYLGYPSLALMIVMSSLLLGCGLGALLVHWQGENEKIKGGSMALLASLLLLALEFSHGFLFRADSTLGLFSRAAFVFLLFFPLGLLLGTLMPLGMKKIGSNKQNSKLVAWAWAVNGCTSVLGSCAATLSALFLGFTYTAYLGAAFYLMASLAFVLAFRNRA